MGQFFAQTNGKLTYEHVEDEEDIEDLVCKYEDYLEEAFDEDEFEELDENLLYWV